MMSAISLTDNADETALKIYGFSATEGGGSLLI